MKTIYNSGYTKRDMILDKISAVAVALFMVGFIFILINVVMTPRSHAASPSLAYNCQYKDGTEFFSVKKEVKRRGLKKYFEDTNDVHYIREALGCIVVLSISKFSNTFSESSTCGDTVNERRYHGVCVK